MTGLDGQCCAIKDVELVADFVVDLARVQGVVGFIGLDVVVVLNNETAGEGPDFIELGEVMESTCRDQGGSGKGREDGSDLHGCFCEGMVCKRLGGVYRKGVERVEGGGGGGVREEEERVRAEVLVGR